jgi:hypothetical protein
MLAAEPLSLTAAVDAAFRLYRHHFTPFFFAGLIGVLPGAIAGVAASHAVPLWALAPLLGASVFGLAFGVAACSHLTSEAVRGAPLRLGDGLRAAWGCGARVAGGATAVALVGGLGLMLLAIPGALFIIRSSLLLPIVALERSTLRRAVARSWALTRRRELEVAATLGVWLGLAGVFACGATAAVAFNGSLSEAQTAALVTSLLIPGVAAWAVPLLGIALTLLYIESQT